VNVFRKQQIMQPCTVHTYKQPVTDRKIEIHKTAVDDTYIYTVFQKKRGGELLQ